MTQPDHLGDHRRALLGEACLVDSHAHLGDPRFDHDRGEVIARARKGGVRWMVMPGADLETSRRAVEVGAMHEQVTAAVGVSPHDAGNVREDDWEALTALAAHPKVVAWGEVGLDYHYELSDRETQKRVLRRQLGLARELDLPVILHFREAGTDFFDILETQGLPAAGGVMHCFTGTEGEMRLALELGLRISFAGVVTFPKSAAAFADLIARVPDDLLLVETDAPYMAPVPYRGNRSEPFMVAEVVRRVAEVKGVGFEAAARLTAANAERLFRIPGKEG